MKARLLLIVVLFLSFSSGVVWAIENPVGLGTVPPSSMRSGLIRSPNPIDTSTNLVITGNVRRGKHFRGVVPYRAPFDFGDTLGSSSLHSFLRDSAGPEGLDRFSEKYEPYYSPSQTVTAMRPGRSAVFRPPTAKIAGAAPSPDTITTLPPLPEERVLSDRDTAVGTPGLKKYIWEGSYFPISREMEPEAVLDIRFRPMSRTIQELEEVLVSEAEKYQQVPIDETGKQYQKQMEQFQRDLGRVGDKAVELERRMVQRDDSLQISTAKKPGEDVLQSERDGETLIPEEQAEVGKQFDVYEQMKQQIDELQKSLESQLAGIVEQGKEIAEAEAAEGSEKKEESSSGKFFEWDLELDEESPGTEVDLSTRAKAILGEHKTFASYSKDKFNQYLRAAEDYLKRGRYYRAADAYTLASIYKPGDPLVYAGKSHALFAAGEYMSSALFLARALEIFPEYVRFKIDIVAMVGSRDKIESRIVDVEQWLEGSDAPELRFLLAYVCYQLNRLGRAKRAIDAAYEKMPKSPAVITLKKAIDESREW